MLHALLLASLISLSAVVDASAQVAAATNEGFTTLADAHKLLIIVDDAGQETWGRLVRLTAEELTVTVSGRDRTFLRPQVATVYERGDSLKNGALIGLMSGAALGFAGGMQSSCGDGWSGLHPCSASEKISRGAGGALFLGAFGAALGAGTDALRIGRHVVYRRATATASPAETSTANFARSMVNNRLVSVIDDSGFEWKGRLITFDADSLTVAVDGSDVTFDRSNVLKIYERGNSVKKGMLFGALSGPALLLAALASGDPVTGGDAAVGLVFFSGLGFAIGTAVDAMIPGKHLIYEKGRGSIGRQSSISIAPMVSPSRLALQARARW